MSVKIIPKINNDGLISIAELKQGDCFIADDTLWMLTLLIHVDSFAIDFTTGIETEFSVNEQVIPVDVEITWKKRQTKKDKK